jgi:polysaccharide deacetylase family protein (PEP-CTERM system associated)
MRNILTVDVEEYFHPTEMQSAVAVDQWDSLPSRVEAQVEEVLDLLRENGAQATFFVVGWVAHRNPQVVRRIAAEGHEIGCHSYAHQLVYGMTPAEFRKDTRLAVEVIRDACGITPQAYRAPSYSINRDCFWALDILAEMGFTHDSSIFPIHHDRYGIPDFERFATIVETQSGPILELPIATVKLPGGRISPVGGGGYMRLLPYAYTAAGIRRIQEEEQAPACIYFHPWELDDAQPRLACGTVARLRTYTGLRGFRGKLKSLLRDFEFGTVSEIHPFATDLCAAAAAAR